jgi:hypothetical protein
MKKILLVVSTILTSTLFGQGFTYSYVDPCSKETKVLSLTSNQLVTVNYLGNINSFSQSDFLNGTFDNWISQIQTQAANQPCDELLTNTQSSQNMFITQNLISTLTSITASSTMTASNAVANSVSNSTTGNSSSRRANRNSSNNQQNTNSNGTTNNSQGPSSNSSSTQSGGTNQGTSQSSTSTNGGGSSQEGGTTNQSNNVPQGGSGTSQQSVNSQGQSSSGGNTQTGTNTNQSGSGNTQSGTNSSQGQNSTEGSTKQNETSGGGGGGGTTNSVSNAASSTSGNKSGRANVGSVIGTGDIVAIRVNENKSSQLRGTMSITKTNTNNTRAKGMLLNFTSTVNNTNLTLYGAFNSKKRINTLIVANSSMIDFDRNFFNTTTVLDSRKFGKTALMGGLNFTVGGLAGEMFTNISAVGGGFHPFKINNKISGNILVLGVYSPFTKFYEGKWWDSGLLVVPFSSWDYTISKNFKYNVSFSGTYEVKGSVLQFQVLTGGKILL